MTHNFLSLIDSHFHLSFLFFLSLFLSSFHDTTQTARVTCSSCRLFMLWLMNPTFLLIILSHEKSASSKRRRNPVRKDIARRMKRYLNRSSLNWTCHVISSFLPSSFWWTPFRDDQRKERLMVWIRYNNE